MRLLLLGVLMLLGCAPSHSRPLVAGRGGASAPSGSSLLVRGGTEGRGPEEWAVFLPVEFKEAGHGGWSAKVLRAAGYRVDRIELDDTSDFVSAQVPASESGELLARRPPRWGGSGGPPSMRRPPLLNPRPTPQQREESQRRAADRQAVQAARELYFQRLAEAEALYPNSQGYQDHHFIPVYLGGPRNGVTYSIPTAYHKLITRQFRKEWEYSSGNPSPEQLQKILLKVYSQHPIPQLIGITP
jgi:hypothetical protein